MWNSKITAKMWRTKWNASPHKFSGEPLSCLLSLHSQNSKWKLKKKVSICFLWFWSRLSLTFQCRFGKTGISNSIMNVISAPCVTPRSPGFQNVFDEHSEQTNSRKWTFILSPFYLDRLETKLKLVMLPEYGTFNDEESPFIQNKELVVTSSPTHHWFLVVGFPQGLKQHERSEWDAELIMIPF